MGHTFDLDDDGRVNHIHHHRANRCWVNDCRERTGVLALNFARDPDGLTVTEYLSPELAVALHGLLCEVLGRGEPAVDAQAGREWHWEVEFDETRGVIMLASDAGDGRRYRVSPHRDGGWIASIFGLIPHRDGGSIAPISGQILIEGDTFEKCLAACHRDAAEQVAVVAE